MNTLVEIIENRSAYSNRSEIYTWKGVVSPRQLNLLKDYEHDGGYKRYIVDIYQDVKSKVNKTEITKLNLILNQIGVSLVL